MCMKIGVGNLVVCLFRCGSLRVETNSSASFLLGRGRNRAQLTAATILGNLATDTAEIRLLIHRCGAVRGLGVLRGLDKGWAFLRAPLREFQ